MKDNIFFKGGFLIISAFFFFAGLYFAKDILVPLLFAILLSMLVLPLCRKLEKKIGQMMAITTCVLIIVAVNCAFFYLIYTQISNFAEDFPLFKTKSLEKYQDLQKFIESSFNISTAQQRNWIEKNTPQIVHIVENIIKSILIGFSSGLIIFLLVVVYTFLILLLRRRINNFLLITVMQAYHVKVKEILFHTEKLSLHYVRGLLIETVLVGVLNTIGLLLLGIKQPIFWGFFASLLNLIPYIGAIIALIFPMLMAIVYKDSLWYTIGVFIVLMFTHTLHAKIFVPKIVGAHLKVNALATITVIVLGGVLWGIAGMILFLPLLGIVKILCDNIKALRPIGYLIGEENNFEELMKEEEEEVKK